MKNNFVSFLNNLISFVKVFFFGVLVFYSCQPKGVDNEKDGFKTKSSESQASRIRHSVGFDLIERDHYKLLHIYRHYNETIDTLSYVFSDDLPCPVYYLCCKQASELKNRQGMDRPERR